APWANAGPNQRVNAGRTNGTAAVRLDGTGSADPDGAIVSYTWSQDGALIATGASPTINLSIGTNLIFLTLTDNAGETATAATTVTVLPPLAVTLSGAPTLGSSPPLTVQFTGSASGGPSSPAPDTTDDHLGAVTAQGENNGINGLYEVAANAFDDNIGT